VIVSNGKYFGGGMKIAPGADLSDRSLDVLTIGDVGKLELLQVFPASTRAPMSPTPRCGWSTLRRSESNPGSACWCRLMVRYWARPGQFQNHPGALSLAV